MNKNEFIEKLDELINDVINGKILVKNSRGLGVEILDHTPNGLSIELSDGKKLNIVVYGNNYCFFDAYKIDSKEIIDKYKLVLKEYEESNNAVIKEMLQDNRPSTVCVNKHYVNNTYRKFAGFDEDCFMRFILSEVSPSTNKNYSESSAQIYSREICKVLASGVALEEFSNDIDKYIYEYTDKNGSIITIKCGMIMQVNQLGIVLNMTW